MSSKSSGFDFILANYPEKGRMTSVKTSLFNKIQTALPTATVIDAWRLPTWSFSSFNGVLVSVKINPSNFAKLSYGNRITNQYEGQYMAYHFSIHVIARYDFVREDARGLASKPAYDFANALIKYLRRHNTDESLGVLDIWQITARESDPSGGSLAGAHMSRIIIEGNLLAERPWRAAL
jgi:hypothetical protein